MRKNVIKPVRRTTLKFQYRDNTVYREKSYDMKIW